MIFFAAQLASSGSSLRGLSFSRCVLSLRGARFFVVFVSSWCSVLRFLFLRGLRFSGVRAFRRGSVSVLFFRGLWLCLCAFFGSRGLIFRGMLLSVVFLSSWASCLPAFFSWALWAFRVLLVACRRALYEFVVLF